ncbi:MAG: hypothetical protein U0667_08550 [Chloroflexota bacterium]
MNQQRGATETLVLLEEVSQQIDRLEAERERLVAAARAENRSWRAIADALGVSRQAAWKTHRVAGAVVQQIRDRSDLSEADAMALSKELQREVRSGSQRK